MEGNGTETKYMLNSAICVQKRPWPLKKALQSQNMTLLRNSAMVQFISQREITPLCFVNTKCPFIIFPIHPEQKKNDPHLNSLRKKRKKQNIQPGRRV